MRLTKHLLEGAKLAALFGAIALVVWTMPEYRDDIVRDVVRDTHDHRSGFRP